MKSLLVTGGAGFIGPNFVRCVLRHRPEARIVNLDALTYAGSLENLKDLPTSERHRFVQGDIRDGALVEGLLRTHEIEAIIHFAAESHVDRSIEEPAAFVQTNVVGPFTLLEAARRVWQEAAEEKDAGRRFLHISTDEVFGSLGPDDPPFSEVTHYAPT